jgi:hypothetical protein
VMQLRAGSASPKLGSTLQPTPTAMLHELADQLERLRPDWRSPEAFFSRRSELAAQLRSMALPRPQQGLWRPPERRPAILLTT